MRDSVLCLVDFIGSLGVQKSSAARQEVFLAGRVLPPAGGRGTADDGSVVFTVFVGGTGDHIGRKLGSGRLFLPAARLQPVTDKLLVIGGLGMSRLVDGGSPEARA